MKNLFTILFVLCLSQYSTAKVITVKGKLLNIDKTEISDIRVFWVGIESEAFAEEIFLDSLGNFEVSVEKWKFYRLEVYSKNYYSYKKRMRVVTSKPSRIRVRLTKREKPLAFIPVPSANFSLITTIGKSDSSLTSLQGNIIDETGEPLMFATVAVKRNQALITGTQSDLEGEYTFEHLDTGTYDIEVSYVGYPTKRISNVKVTDSTITLLNVVMKESIEFYDCCWEGYSVPLIEHDNTTQGAVFTFDDIRRSPHKN